MTRIFSRWQKPGNLAQEAEMPSPESEAYVQRLCARLREVRLEAGISQERLADLSGVDHGVISRLETHKRTPAMAALRDLAVALGLDWPALCKEIEGMRDGV